MARRIDTTLALVERLYDAAGDADAWPAFLDALAQAVAGVVPGVYLSGRATETGLLGVVSGLSADWNDAYESHFKHCDLRRRRIQELPADTVFVGSELLPDRELVRSEFYNDFLRPQGFFHILGGVPLKTEDLLGVVRVIRPRTSRPFARDDVAMIRRLMPHLSRALRLHHQLAVAALQRDEGLEVLDRFPAGILLLDTAGRVVAANRTAEGILATGHGLRAGRDGLKTAVPDETATLQRLVAAAAQGGSVDDAGGSHGGVLNVTRPAHERPLNLLVVPLRGGLLRRAAGRAVVVVFVTDPDRQPTAPVEHFQRWLQLTRAEASLVVELLRGRHVDDAAAALGISEHTARTQLKRALAKTGTRRQAELVRLALGTPGGLSR